LTSSGNLSRGNFVINAEYVFLIAFNNGWNYATSSGHIYQGVTSFPALNSSTKQSVTPAAVLNSPESATKFGYLIPLFS